MGPPRLEGHELLDSYGLNPREKSRDRMRRPLVGFYGGAHRAPLRAVMPKFLSATLNFSSGRRRR
jgi:hypothetical protein